MLSDSNAFVLTLVTFLIYNLMQILPIWSMWRRRKELLCKARSPGLACCHGIMQLIYTEVIWIQELMRQKGAVMHPSICIWVSCVTLPLIVVPAALRAARVVIITSRDQRSKKLQALNSSSQIHALAINLIIHLLLGVLAELSRTLNFWVHDYNYLFQPWQIFGTMSLLSTIPTFKSCEELLAAKDALRVGRELVRCQICVYFTVLPYYALVALHDYGVIEMDTRVQFILLSTVIYWNLETFVFSRPRWANVKHGTSKVGVQNHDVSTASDALELDPESCQRAMTTWKSSLHVMNHPALNVLYCKFVEQNLCFESYEFIKVATEYARRVSGIDAKDYEDFNRIVQDFIIQGSALEVNINDRMRRAVQAYLKKTAYTELPAENKRKIFDPCVTEVSSMLDLNLMAAFHKTDGFKKVVAAEYCTGSTSAQTTRTVMLSKLNLTAKRTSTMEIQKHTGKRTSLDEAQADLVAVEELL